MLSYSQRSSRWCHSNSFSILIDPIITGYQEGGKRGEWGGGGVGEEDLKICLVITMSAEALQSDLVKIFPNFQNYT